MSEGMNAVEAAVYAALAGAGLSWPVYQHVPEDTPPPVNIIGDMSAEPLDSKDGDDARVSLDVQSVFQGEARKPVLDEQARIITALDEAVLSSGGFTVRPLLETADAVLLPDGETYLGTTRFTVMALKN